MFSLPEFPSTCDVYSMFAGFDFADRFFRFTVECQLRLYGPRIWTSSSPVEPTGILAMGASILFPPLTDVRDTGVNPGFPDIIECPSGSGRWYIVAAVDDVAKGFANEYRRVFVNKAFSCPALPTFPFWPTPIP